MFFIMIRIIRKRNEVKEEDIEKFDKMYGTFFDEFSGNDKKNFWFYPIFYLRRIFLSLIIFFVTIPIFRLILSFILSLMRF